MALKILGDYIFIADIVKKSLNLVKNSKKYRIYKSKKIIFFIKKFKKF